MNTPQEIFAATARYVDQRLAQGRSSMQSPDTSEFIVLARAVAAGRGDMQSSADVARQYLNAPRVHHILKTAVSAANLADPAWAGNIVGYNDLVQSFLGSLANFSAFDAMLSATRRAPLRTRIAAVTVPINGSVVGNGAGIPVSRLTLAPFTLEELTAAALIVLSDELVYGEAPGSSAFLRSELQSAVAVATDTQFVSILRQTAAHTRASSGNAATAIRNDVARAIDDIDVGAASRLFLLVPPKVFQRLGIVGTTTGASAFPDMTESAMGRIQVRPSDALIGDSSGGTAILVDADAIVANSDTLTLDSSNQASIQMADPTTMNSVTPTATTTTSLWQTNSIGLRCIRHFGATVARANGVSVVTGVSW